MAKKRTGKTAKKRLKEEIIEKTKSRCFTCTGMGNMCDRCGESEAACECPADTADDDCQVLSSCDDCFGTGIASADIEESDLEPEDVAEWKRRSRS